MIKFIIYADIDKMVVWIWDTLRSDHNYELDLMESYAKSY